MDPDQLELMQGVLEDAENMSEYDLIARTVVIKASILAREGKSNLVVHGTCKKAFDIACSAVTTSEEPWTYEDIAWAVQAVFQEEINVQ